MDNKAPGTNPRPQGYESTGGGQKNENFFHPRRVSKKNLQRVGIRVSRRVAVTVIVTCTVFLGVPMMLGPLWVNYVARWEWVQRAQAAAKSIWTRRNEKDWDMYMTQRQNSLWEMMGLKRYRIGDDENPSDGIQKYK